MNLETPLSAIKVGPKSAEQFVWRESKRWVMPITFLPRGYEDFSEDCGNYRHHARQAHYKGALRGGEHRASAEGYRSQTATLADKTGKLQAVV